MNKLIIAFTFISFSSVLQAKCNTKAIGFVRESGFSISFGGGSDSAGFYDKDTVNVPLTINGTQACFKEKQKLSLGSEKKSGSSNKNSVVLSPAEVDFENVPSPHQKQYIIAEKKEQQGQTKFHVLSFVCSGETPLSIKAISSRVSDLENPKDNAATVKTNAFIATGKAAQILGENYSSQLASIETYDIFSQKYKELTLKEVDSSKPCCESYNTPSILTATSINSLSSVERSIASRFTTMGSDVPNGCSKDFAETMSKYQLQNFSENDTLKGINIKKKGWFSKDLLFEW